MHVVHIEPRPSGFSTGCRRSISARSLLDYAHVDMNRARLNEAVQRRERTDRAYDPAPGRSTLTQSLEVGGGDVGAPDVTAPSWSAAALVDEQTARAHGLVQFDPSATPDRDAPERIHELAAHGTSGAGGALPHLDAIQRSFGRHDVRGISAHVGGAATEAAAGMGARAYATGDAVAFADAPDLHLAAHEAAHVVQQRGGVQLSGGVGAAGDAYEQHADAVADQVVRGESAEDLLDEYEGGSPSVQRSVVQLDRRPLSAAGNRLIETAGQIQTRIDDLEARYPDVAHPVRQAMQRLHASALFDELGTIIQRVHDAGGEPSQALVRRVIQINELVGQMENARATEPAPSGPRARPPEPDTSQARAGQYPEFFGQASTDAMRRIEQYADSWRWVGRLTIAATVISIASSQTGSSRRQSRDLVGNAAQIAVTGSEGIYSAADGGSLDVGTQAEAIRGMNDIARRGIIDIATLTLAGERLNRQERAFWTNLIRNLGGTV